MLFELFCVFLRVKNINTTLPFMRNMTTFASGSKIIMCTRTIKINDALMDRVKPLFSNDEDLQRWLEEQIETALLSISSGQEAEMPCCSDDEMCKIVKERLELMESGEATYIDGEEGFAQIRAKYGL